MPAPEFALTGGGGDLVVDSQNRPYVHLSFFDPEASGDLDTVLVRFASDGDLDPTFPGGGLLLIDTGDAVDSVSGALAIEFPAGQPLLLVEADQAASGKQTNLVRFENALIFADGLEWGSTKFWN